MSSGPGGDSVAGTIEHWRNLVQTLNFAVENGEAELAADVARSLAEAGVPVRVEDNSSIAPQTATNFVPGEEVRYFSISAGDWIPATVLENPHDGSLQLDVVPNFRVPAWKVRAVVVPSSLGGDLRRGADEEPLQEDGRGRPPAANNRPDIYGAGPKAR